MQIPNPERPEPDWQQGYGFQLWMSQHGYRGDGAFGQYMVVLPELDAVIAMFSCVENMQRVLDVMWAHFVAPTDDGNDDIAESALTARLAALTQRSAADRRSRRAGRSFRSSVPASPSRFRRCTHLTDHQRSLKPFPARIFGVSLSMRASRVAACLASAKCRLYSR